jgi:two-component system sensor histidine kinase KdpD
VSVIATELSESSSRVEISVIDDGAGFPAALARAPFDTARRLRSRSSGAGLGLSIARGIVDAHGGRIELAPVSAGTAFRIRLPIEASETGSNGGGAGETEDSSVVSADGTPATRSAARA